MLIVPLGSPPPSAPSILQEEAESEIMSRISQERLWKYILTASLAWAKWAENKLSKIPNSSLLKHIHEDIIPEYCLIFFKLRNKFISTLKIASGPIACPLPSGLWGGKLIRALKAFLVSISKYCPVFLNVGEKVAWFTLHFKLMWFLFSVCFPVILHIVESSESVLWLISSTSTWPLYLRCFLPPVSNCRWHWDFAQ